MTPFTFGWMRSGSYLLPPRDLGSMMGPNFDVVQLDNCLQSVSFFFVRLHQRVLFIQVPQSLLPLVSVGSAFYSQNIVNGFKKPETSGTSKTDIRSG